MASYVVLIPPAAEAGDERAVILRDGFLWLALIAPLLWFVWYRMWLWAALYLVIGLAVAVAVERTEWHATAILLGALTSLWAALEAGGLRVADLRRRGWTVSDVIEAPGRTATEAIHFRNVAEPESDGADEPPAPPPPLAPLSRLRPRDDGPALGLFGHD